MELYSSFDLKKGAKIKETGTGWDEFSQPLQFLPISKKTEEWAAHNMDWLERNGLEQIKKNARRLMKNYRLADGIIDKTDYIPEEKNDMNELVSTLAKDDELESMELKFFPIIPNVVNTLMSEFSARIKKISFRAKDEYTFNEIAQEKYEAIEDVLLKKAEAKLSKEFLEMGEFNDPQVIQEWQQKMSPENLKTLPEIQDFFAKDYRVISEIWAQKQYEIDESRFNMEELEEVAFKDLLIADREFWHFKMLEDDFDIEVWNPVTTFYHKSPKERYLSNGNFVGHIDIMTAADIIDSYGWRMSEEQLLKLERKALQNSPRYVLGGYQNDGAYYDATKSHQWNTEGPSLGMRQMLSTKTFHGSYYDTIGKIYEDSEDGDMFEDENMFRVTTAYWKSQVRIGHLTRIDENGIREEATVSEQYKITEKPIYNTNFIKEKTAETLVFGEHIEWIWINQVWGGIKIGPNTPTSYFDNGASLGIEPMYLGINSNKIGPMLFQFKGDRSWVGCKLPVEGRIYSDRNTKSMSLVDKQKPFQIAYNIVNNQIADILVDEIGTVIMLDQNALPQHSMGEDWGSNNLAKAYVAMKDFSMLPLDTSSSNTKGPINFQNYQKLDLAQTERLKSRVDLAIFFKQQAYEQIGLSPQRMGQQIGTQTTATDVKQIQVGSFNQTENYFSEHSVHLMPRVHQMRTDLAQYYNSTKPSIQLQMTNSNDERTNFEMNGTDLLLRDIHVYCTSNVSMERILEQMKQFALNNNTAGGSIYDIGRILQADSIGTLNMILKQSETRLRNEKMQETQQQQQMEQQMFEFQEKAKQEARAFEAQEKALDRENNLKVAEVRSAGYTGQQDLNKNNINDFDDHMLKMKKAGQIDSRIELDKNKADVRNLRDQEKVDLRRQELATKMEMKEKDLAIARENKNKYDFGKK